MVFIWKTLHRGESLCLLLTYMGPWRSRRHRGQAGESHPVAKWSYEAIFWTQGIQERLSSKHSCCRAKQLFKTYGTLQPGYHIQLLSTLEASGNHGLRTMHVKWHHAQLSAPKHLCCFEDEKAQFLAGVNGMDLITTGRAQTNKDTQAHELFVGCTSWK